MKDDDTIVAILRQRETTCLPDHGVDELWASASKELRFSKSASRSKVIQICAMKIVVCTPAKRLQVSTFAASSNYLHRHQFAVSDFAFLPLMSVKNFQGMVTKALSKVSI